MTPMGFLIDILTVRGVKCHGFEYAPDAAVEKLWKLVQEKKIPDNVTVRFEIRNLREVIVFRFDIDTEVSYIV